MQETCTTEEKIMRIIGLSNKFSIFLTLFAFAVFAEQTRITAQVTGAIFTTNSTCSSVDQNIYGARADVYLNGGPAHPGAAGLPDGEYYAKVTAPDGTLLGTSLGTTDEKPVDVVGGVFQSCYQLVAILRRPGSSGPVPDGFDVTPNPGGEYKVWVSDDSAFTNNRTKTDNFKVRDESQPPRSDASLRVRKYYDADADGVLDAGEAFLTGWKFNISGPGLNNDRFTPILMVLDPGTYVVTERLPSETYWINTDPGAGNLSKSITLAADDIGTLDFGNVCLGAGGGLTLGFWSNKNGQLRFGGDDLALLVSLNLRNANGSAFDPTGYTVFRTWILGATAANMAYMLSAQLAAMELNVNNGNVTGSSIIYAPGTISGLPAGFATVSAVMAEANTELGLHGDTTSGSAFDSFRGYQEALKTALDRGNNNLNFVQPTPCAFTFPATN